MRYALLSEKANPIMNIQQIGYSKSPDITRFGPFVRNNYIVHYVVGGKGSFNGIPVSEGEGFLITPGMLEEYKPSLDDPWELLWVIFDDDKRISDVFAEYDAGTNGIFQYKNTEYIHTLCSNIVSDTDRIYDPYTLLGIYFELFSKCSFFPMCSCEKTSGIDYVDFAVNYIDNNISERLSVSELTCLTGISQPYLYRIFKKKLGISPKEYIIFKRIETAKYLLQTTSMSIGEISKSVGYDDAMEFSRLFRHKMGISPSEYRKEQ